MPKPFIDTTTPFVRNYGIWIFAFFYLITITTMEVYRITKGIIMRTSAKTKEITIITYVTIKEFIWYIYQRYHFRLQLPFSLPTLPDLFEIIFLHRILLLWLRKKILECARWLKNISSNDKKADKPKMIKKKHKKPPKKVIKPIPKKKKKTKAEEKFRVFGATLWNKKPVKPSVPKRDPNRRVLSAYDEDLFERLDERFHLTEFHAKVASGEIDINDLY